MANGVNVFKNKNYSLLFYGVLVSNIAHILFNFVMSLYVLRIAKEVFGESNAALVQGIYLGLAGIVLVIFMPFGGVLADRINKVRIMYITDYIRGFVILAVGLVIFFNPSSEVKLIFLFIMILGGIMFAVLDVYAIFIINGVAYLISAITEMFIKYNHEAHQSKDETNNVLKEMISGIKYLFNYKPMFALIIMALSLNFFIVPILNNGFPYFIEFGLGKESSYLFDSFLTIENWYSIILITFSVAGIIMALILSRIPKKESYGSTLIKSIIAFVIAVSSISVTMILFYTDVIQINLTLILILIGCLFSGLASTSFNIPVQIIMQNKTDPSQLGKIVSVSSVLSQALIPFASLMAGLVISKLSVIPLYIICTLGLVVVAIVYYFNKSYLKL